MTVRFEGEGIIVASLMRVCAFSNYPLLTRSNVWCRGDVNELDSTVVHKDLTVREADGWQTLTEQEDGFYDRALPGAMETPRGVSDPHQDF